MSKTFSIPKHETMFVITSFGKVQHKAFFPRAKREAITELCRLLNLSFSQEFNLLHDGFIYIEDGNTKVEVIE